MRGELALDGADDELVGDRLDAGRSARSAFALATTRAGAVDESRQEGQDEAESEPAEDEPGRDRGAATLGAAARRPRSGSIRRRPRARSSERRRRPPPRGATGGPTPTRHHRGAGCRDAPIPRRGRAGRRRASSSAVAARRTRVGHGAGSPALALSATAAHGGGDLRVLHVGRRRERCPPDRLSPSPRRSRRSGSGFRRRTQRTGGHPLASAPRWRCASPTASTTRGTPAASGESRHEPLAIAGLDARRPGRAAPAAEPTGRRRDVRGETRDGRVPRCDATRQELAELVEPCARARRDDKHRRVAQPVLASNRVASSSPRVDLVRERAGRPD